MRETRSREQARLCESFWVAMVKTRTLTPMAGHPDRVGNDRASQGKRLLTARLTCFVFSA